MTTGFFPHIGQESEVVVSGISFIENEAGLDFLEITYSLREALLENKLETSRVIDYGLKPKFFNEFRQESLWVIPEGTTISVELPLGAEIKQPVKPDADIQTNLVSWQGYVSGNELALNYSLFKQIASFDLSQAIREVMQSDLFLIFVVVAVIVLGIVLAKRKAISGKIENYVLAHSNLGGEEEEE